MLTEHAVIRTCALAPSSCLLLPQETAQISLLSRGAAPPGKPHPGAIRDPDTARWVEYDKRRLDVDSPPGNSGGPMFNTKGEVIGIVSHNISKSGGSEGLGFVVTLNGQATPAREAVVLVRSRRVSC